MKKIYKNITELIGNTPLLELVKLKEENKLKAKYISKSRIF